MIKNKTIALLTTTLEDMKASDILVLDVQHFNSCMDQIIIATGNSQRHVKSIAEKIAFTAKQQGIIPLGIEGAEQGEWVLVDLGDIVIHIMQREIRSFYNLEKLWSTKEVNPINHILTA